MSLSDADTALVLCLAIQKKVQQDGPDISRLASHLQQQWDHAGNADLGNTIITPGTGRIVWWVCDQCRDGYPHRWLARVFSRSNGSGCPQCSGRKVCKHKSLATIAPQAVACWDFAKNSCTPEDLTAFSNIRAHWHCQVCGHGWVARVASVSARGSGCPRCNAGGVREADSSRRQAKHPTFEKCQHPLLSEWDHERNEAEGILPSNTTLRSSKRVHWLCSQCPAGQPHRWVLAPSDRLGKFGNKESGCPMCVRQVACKCNSLQWHYPAIAAEWDYERNEGGPGDYGVSSGYKAWWRTPAGGSWQRTITARTNNERVKEVERCSAANA